MMIKKLKMTTVVIGILGAFTMLAVPTTTVSAITLESSMREAKNSYTASAQRLDSKHIKVLVKGNGTAKESPKVVVTATFFNKENVKSAPVQRTAYINSSNKQCTVVVGPPSEVVAKLWVHAVIQVQVDGKTIRTLNVVR